MSSQTVFGQPVNRVLLGAAVAGSLAYLLYLLRKTRSDAIDAVNLPDDPSDPYDVVNNLKEQGNQHFASKNYAAAASLFLKAINILKEADDADNKTSTLAVLYNNYSACNEYLDDVEKALANATEAIELNPEYLKPYVRRSRILKRKYEFKRCLYDLGKIIKIINKDRNTFIISGDTEKFVAEIVTIGNGLVSSFADKLVESRYKSAQYMPISQTNVVEWMTQTVLHDPLLERMRTQGDAKPTEPLDLALWHLKRYEFDEIMPLAFKVSVSTKVDVRERIMARLLLARAYLYANLLGQAMCVYNALNAMWNAADQDFQKANRDLQVAIMVLDIHIEGVRMGKPQLKISFDEQQGNADAVVVAAVAFNRMRQHDEALKSIELARQLEPDRPNLEYHECAIKFAQAINNQDVNAVHSVTALMDQKLRSMDNLPEHAVLLGARLFMAANNSEYALELMKNYQSKGNKNSVGLDLLYIVLKNEINPEKKPRTIGDFEKDLRKLLQRDPANFEIWRLVFRCHIEKGEFHEAVEAATQALHNTKIIEDFFAIYNDLILASALAGENFPTLEYPKLAGPAKEYIRVDSQKVMQQLVASSLP